MTTPARIESRSVPALRVVTNTNTDTNDRTATGDQTEIDGAMLLTDLRTALTTYLVMPSPEATDAVVLWIAATHAQPALEHATRLAITGPAKRCGKSRLLEIIRATCYKALPVVNSSTAALYRSIDVDPPTILFDEVDAIFGTKRAAEANEDLRALINAGHSRGWPIRRCVGPNQEVAEFTTFAMAALAGIGDMPDTITDRAVNIRMRRRAPGETVKPFRTQRDQPPLFALRTKVNKWVRANLDYLRAAEPEMPVEDRAADTWESLIAVADLAGADWPERARHAAKILTADAAEADTDNSTSLRLLADLRTVFSDAGKLHTTTVLARLRELDNGPWADRQLSAHDLAKLLRQYNVKPRDVRETSAGPNRKGYDRADLYDAWTRYLPAFTDESGLVADTSATRPETATGLTSTVALVADVADPWASHQPPAGDDPPEPP